MRYLRLGAVKGSSLLAQELEGNFPSGSNAAALIGALESAGFNCTSYHWDRRWRGCSIHARRRGSLYGVIRVRVDEEDGALHKLTVDMSFSAIVL